jgi:hypothetical protein
VLVAAGLGILGPPTASAELYDPLAGTFSVTGSLITTRYLHTATLLPNGKVLVAAGIDILGNVPPSAELYDPAAGTFSATGSMTNGRYFHRATLLPNGKVLVAGGYNADVLASAELYSPVLPVTPPADNRGPIVSGVTASPNPVAINVGITLTANVDDSTTGASNIASAGYNIDGGASFVPMTSVPPAGQVSENFVASMGSFPTAGLHTPCVQGTDAAGNVGDQQCTLLVVYDPTGGFVTGGGAIDSPAGADQVNTGAAGPANFGFNSKYLPGRSIPDGDLQFQFKAGNLTFKSTSMDWLVVTGEPRAQFQGTGTINGATVCKFAVDAWGGSFPSGTGKNVDAFGLKIFSCAGGGDRYSLAATPLKQGSIIIHK